jgi:hypothetical protein
MSLTDLKYCREANAKLKAQLSALTQERDELKDAIAKALVTPGRPSMCKVLQAALQPPAEEQQQ